MIKSKTPRSITFKNHIINIIMKNGKKRTGEKILLKSLKSLQKSTQKNFQNLIQFAIVNSTSTFKLNEQTMKKGKRKSKKVTPSFITKDTLRVMTAIKSLIAGAVKDKSSINFYESFKKEVLDASSFRGNSVEQRSKLQAQILVKKRYLAKFRW